MSDARRIKELLRERVAELAQYLFPDGHRERAHWAVGSIDGEPGKSFKICVAGEKAGLWGDFAESGG
jgi:twinkle protein